MEKNLNIIKGKHWNIFLNDLQDPVQLKVAGNDYFSKLNNFEGYQLPSGQFKACFLFSPLYKAYNHARFGR